MERYAHPYHRLTDAEQARWRWMLRTTMDHEAATEDWRLDYTWLLVWKRASGLLRRPGDSPPVPNWLPTEEEIPR
jgi:hypothetical protein